MYYYNNNNDNNINNNNNNLNDNQQPRKDNIDNNNNNDDPYLSHSLDSMFRAQQNQQDWTDDALASYLSLGLHSHSLDSPFFNDAFGQFPQTTTSTGEWDIFGQQPTQQDQQQQQQQQQQQHFHGNNNDFNDNNAILKLQNDDMLLNEQVQQAILLSDPNFLRQQQLLQEQQKQMEIRKEREEHQEDEFILTTTTTSSSSTTANISTSAPVRSNLSAMFGHTTLQNQQPQQQRPADINTTSNTAAATSATIRAKKPSAIKKETTNRRSSSSTVSSGSSGSTSKRNTNPIPISSSSSSNEVDHQRRLNELQARFRVNYARKPNLRKQHQQQQSQQQQSSSAMAQSFEPSSLPNFSSDHHAQAGLERRRSASITVDPPQRQQPTMRVGRMPRAPAVSNTKSSAASITRVTGAASTGSNSTNTSSTTTSTPLASTTPSSITSTGSTQQQSTAPFPSRTMPIQIQRVQRPNASLQLDKEQRQRKLDEQLEKVDFDDITVSELKEMLRQRGKPATGKKAILVQRLLDERELIKAIKSGRIPPQQRHSLPATVDIPSSLSDTIQQHASSVPSVSGFPPPPPGPSSPGSTLNRSIANMHIGSPPVQHQQQIPPQQQQQQAQSTSRRFAPYSPTIRTTGSPKQQHQALYSSSMPTNNYLTPMDETSRTPRYPRHKYAPRTPSALATPDHEEELNPFDQFIMMHQQQQMQSQQQHVQQQQSQVLQQQQQTESQPQGEQMQQEEFSRVMDMEWDASIVDPNFSQQDGNVDMSKLTQEELLQLFTGTDMTLDNTFLR